MTTITEKLAEALRGVTKAYASVITSDYQTRANPDPLADDEAYQTARTTLAEYEASVSSGPLPIGTRILMLENRSFWKAGEVTELVSCNGWGDAESSMDAGGDYWARGNGVKRFCTSRKDFEVLAPEYAP